MTAEAEAVEIVIDIEEIEKLVAPYIRARCAVDDPQFRAEMAAIRARLERERVTWRHRLAWWFRRDPRSVAGRQAIWNSKWSERKRYQPGYYQPEGPLELGLWQGQGVYLRNAALTRARLAVLMKAIAALSPRSILEVGCGDGLYSLFLASHFRECTYTAVDLAGTGIAAARSMQQAAALPDYLHRFMPETRLDAAAIRGIDFRHADATQLPFAADQFDVVVTCVALEQMDRVREPVLDQMHRVSRRWAVLLEPFADYVDSPVRRAYKRRSGYFDLPIAALRSNGWQPVAVFSDFPQKVTLGVGLAVFEKI